MQEDESAELEGTNGVVGIEGSIISVPDGPTLAAHEISTLSFTQAFAIYKVPFQVPPDGESATKICNVLVLECCEPGEHALANCL